MEFIAARFPFLELLPIFWSVPGLKKLTKYVGNFENSQIFAGERNILNPKINTHTKKIKNKLVLCHVKSNEIRIRYQ